MHERETSDTPAWMEETITALEEYVDDVGGSGPPGYCCTNKVQCVGESLRPAIWQGRQWSVTVLGVEKRDDTYQIPYELVWEDEGCSWVRNMAERRDVDLNDFCEALKLACRVAYLVGIE